jgi:hypothetical protein
MARWKYNWKFDHDQLNIELDLSAVGDQTSAEYTGGMGIRIDNTNAYIKSVLINGEPYFAFTNQMIILPNLKNNINRIQVKLDSKPSDDSRLIYVSKRMPSIKRVNNRLEVWILTKSKAKFSFKVEQPFILLNSDYQEWNRKGDNILRGYVTSDRQIVLTKQSKRDFFITRATLPITDFDLSDSQISLQLKNMEKNPSEIWFQMERPPKKVTLGNELVKMNKHNQHYKITVPPSTNTQELIIVF